MEKYVEVTTESGVMALLAEAQVTVKDRELVLVSDLQVGDQLVHARNGAIIAESITAIEPARMALIKYTVGADGMVSEKVVPLAGRVEANSLPCTVADLKEGQDFVIAIHGALFGGKVVSVETLEGDDPTTDPVSLEEEQERRIAALESRLATLETGLETANDIILGLRRNIVEMTAAHIDHLFSDPVMVDTLAQRFLISGANAIAHKAKTSRQRAPQLVVVEGQIPGCVIRARLNEDGLVEIEQQDKDGVWASGAELPEELQKEELRNTFGNLLLSYGAEVGRTYYITDDLSRDEFRDQAAKQAQEQLAAVNHGGATTH